MICSPTLALVVWVACAADGETRLPSQLASVRSSDVRVVKIEDVSWGKTTVGDRLQGTLSVSLVNTLRGKNAAAGTSHSRTC